MGEPVKRPQQVNAQTMERSQFDHLKAPIQTVINEGLAVIEILLQASIASAFEQSKMGAYLFCQSERNRNIKKP